MHVLSASASVFIAESEHKIHKHIRILEIFYIVRCMCLACDNSISGLPMLLLIHSKKKKFRYLNTLILGKKIHNGQKWIFQLLVKVLDWIRCAASCNICNNILFQRKWEISSLHTTPPQYYYKIIFINIIQYNTVFLKSNDYFNAWYIATHSSEIFYAYVQ